ncbi:MAG: 16S rRNA (cytosine(1402)-N(4))-methyltransferase RsmH [Christensenellales bacterium]|jgi:16S rRNA (cytosine1402-N4)-methyltransferase|nr:16S rRNA (cytosine(1402)-N(4))-methyltransferase RsmH [Clostridiales bacterium]
MTEYKHIPVLYNEVLTGLKINPQGIYFDGTLGGAGHSEGILKRLTTGKLIATDKDNAAIENARKKLADYADKLFLINDDYKNIIGHLKKMGISALDGILLDLGVSSYQIDTPERGFSYINDAPLDMRMDTSQSKNAYQVINEYDERELADILFNYGEEKYAKKIASKIVSQRKIKPIESTLELAELVNSCIPPKERYARGNPAKRIFQAVRIEVNDELKGLKEFISEIVIFYLKKGGRMCVITFHSLEDRIVKHCFKELETDCICDKRLPMCVCNKRKEIEIITKKPICGEKEADINKRASSARLRIIERV